MGPEVRRRTGVVTKKRESTRTISLPMTILALFLSGIVGFSIGRTVPTILIIWRGGFQTEASMKSTTTTATTTRSASVRPETPRQLDTEKLEKYELLVHPALFIHDIVVDDDEEEDDDDDPQTIRVAIWTDEIEPVLEILKHAYVSHVHVIGTKLNPQQHPNDPVCLKPEEDRPYWTSHPQIHDSRVQFQEVTITTKDPESCSDLFMPSNHTTTPFDVILVDGESSIGKLVLANSSEVLVQCLQTGLLPLESDQGILVVQVPGFPTEDLIYPLERYGFESILSFDWKRRFDTISTVIAMIDWKTRKRWFLHEAEIAYRIQHRQQRNNNNNANPDDANKENTDWNAHFRIFDGITMLVHQQPSRLAENIWCRNHRMVCQNGNGFDPAIPNFPVSHFHVQRSSVVPGEYGSRGVFTNVTIPRDSYVTLEEFVNDIFFPPFTLDLAILMTLQFDILHEIPQYVDGYGWEMDHHGDTGAFVDAGLMMFVNHGCNDTNNLYSKEDPPVGAFSPFLERRWKILESIDMAKKTLFPGDEIFCDYSEFVEEAHVAKYNDYLARLCAGTEVGEVAEFEQSEIGSGE